MMISQIVLSDQGLTHRYLFVMCFNRAIKTLPCVLALALAAFSRVIAQGKNVKSYNIIFARRQQELTCG